MKQKFNESPKEDNNLAAFIKRLKVKNRETTNKPKMTNKSIDNQLELKLAAQTHKVGAGPGKGKNIAATRDLLRYAASYLASKMCLTHSDLSWRALLSLI